MSETYSATVANAKLDQIETTIGTAPLLRFYNGTMPADADTALAGNTLLAVGALPADWLAAAAARVKSKLGTWSVTGQAAAGAGTAATFYRIYDSTGTTCHAQGTLGVSVVLATSALTAANGNVLTFAATTGVVVGQKVSGAGIVAGSRVLAVSGTTVTLDKTSSAGVASAASITFSYDMAVDNTSIANGQVATVNSYSITGTN